MSGMHNIGISVIGNMPVVVASTGSVIGMIAIVLTMCVGTIDALNVVLVSCSVVIKVIVDLCGCDWCVHHV